MTPSPQPSPRGRGGRARAHFPVVTVTRLLSLPQRSTAETHTALAPSTSIPSDDPGNTANCHVPPRLVHTAYCHGRSPAPAVHVARPPSVRTCGAAGGLSSSHGVAGTSAGVAYGPFFSASAMPPRLPRTVFDFCVALLPS